MNSPKTSPPPDSDETGPPVPDGGKGNPPRVQRRPRRLQPVLFLVLLPAVLCAAAAWLFRETSSRCETDDAYVHGNQVHLVPWVGGTVVSINADDTDLVQKGQPVVILDDSDTRVELQLAEAALGDTLRKVRQFYDNVSQLEASVDARKIDASRAEADFRRRTAVQNGSVSTEELTHAQDGLALAQAALKVAEQQLAAAKALTTGTDLKHHPLVRQAEAHVLAASLAQQRTVICAPETGYVARRNVQIGQRVPPGTPLLTIIPPVQIWVDANFKEAQLKDVRIGQPATLTADYYGRSVKFRGHVAGLGAATGAAFSLLPPQEASGNWIKIVQRVPVRIEMDAAQLEKYPLRLGLTMSAVVDTSDRSGPVLARNPPAKPVYETAIYSGQWNQANELVQHIVADNLETLANAPARSHAPPAEAGDTSTTHE